SAATMMKLAGACSPRRVLRTEIEGESEQRERDAVAQYSRKDQQHRRQHFAAAVEEAAQQQLLAVHRGDGVRAKGHSLVSQQAEAGDRCKTEPYDDRDASPARDTDGRVQVDQRETQYNHQHSESHGGSLAG